MEKSIKTQEFQVIIDIPEGYQIDSEKSSHTKIVFKKIEKRKLPDSWEDLGYIYGNYVGQNSSVLLSSESCPTIPYNKSIFRYPEQAAASIALAQLSQLREVYRKGWKPNWNDINQIKNCIANHEEIAVFAYTTSKHFLSFKDRETAKLFLDNFKGLIEEASPLLFG